MKIIVQRVQKATVTNVDTGEVVGSINSGLFCLVGIKRGDTKEQVAKLSQKLAKLRVLADQNGKMNTSLIDSGNELLIVSQFTLYADTSGGNRPSFIEAAEPTVATDLYTLFIDEMKGQGIHVETGSFGHTMKIDAVLDGPVTIVLEN